MKLIFDLKEQIIQQREMLIVYTQPAHKLSDPLNGIEFRAVWGKKVQGESFVVNFSPLLVEGRMMISGIVADQNDTTTACKSPPSQRNEEFPE